MSTYIWNLEKMLLINLFAGRNRDTDIENGLLDITADRKGWDELTEQH